MTFLTKISTEDKAFLFDRFIERLERINSKCGVIFGSIQIIELLEEDAVNCGVRK